MSSAYNGQFVNYRAIHDYRDILDFLKNKVYSNFSNYESQITKLIAYERQRKYSSDKLRKKIYAINLLVMIPQYLTKNQKHELVKKFMLNISLKYKDILYIYDFIRLGSGSYVNIIAFERQVYKKDHYENDVYKRDMYINKNTGRTTSADDPESLHICKKGNPKLDANGNIIKKRIEISPKKYRYLKFKDNLDEIKKNENFIKFKDKLTKLLIKALSKVTNYSEKIKLRLYQFNEREKLTNKIIKYNLMISRLNIMLLHIQKLFNYDHAFPEEDSAKTDFKILFQRIVRNLENGTMKLSDKVNLIIDPSSKQIGEENYISNLNTFEKYTRENIIKFLYDYFYDPLFDEYYREVKHPFYNYKCKLKERL